MKKILTILLFAFLSILGNAQTPDTMKLYFAGGVTDYNLLTNKPTIPSNVSQLTNDAGYITTVPVSSVASKTGAVILVKSDVGLANVDNTTDASKPVSTPVQTALDLKLNANSNAVSATKLATARNINGVPFDGTANITIADATKEPAFSKNTAFNKNFDVIAGSVPDAKRVYDSLLALRLSLSSKTDTSVRSNVYAVYPQKVRDTTNGVIFYINQSWLDSIYALINPSSLPTYTSPYNAVLNGLKNGDKYKVKDVNGNRLIAIVDTVIAPPSPLLNFDWDNSTGTYPVGNFFAHSNTSTDSMIVDWGDGNTTRQIANGTKDFPVTHTYSSSAVFNVKITFTNNSHITSFYDSSNGGSALRGGISVVRNVSLLTSLTSLTLSNSKIVKFDTITLPNSLAQLYLSKNPLTTFNRASYPAALTTLNLDNTNITALGTTANLPATLTTFSCNNTLMNNAAMNNALVYLDGLTFSGAVNIKLQGYGAPSGAGATAKTSLIGKGNTVTTD